MYMYFTDVFPQLRIVPTGQARLAAPQGPCPPHGGERGRGKGWGWCPRTRAELREHCRRLLPDRQVRTHVGVAGSRVINEPCGRGKK